MAFLKLVRIQNLLLIALTMWGIWMAVVPVPLNPTDRFNFILFVISTMLIAGAGNSINDYFDVRADVMNRPNHVVVGKKIKKRWAIVTHWGFNALAIGVAVYLGLWYKTWFFLGIHLFSIFLLWAYSLYLKKRFFWSNLTIAFLTALIPLISLYFVKLLDVPIVHLDLILLFSVFAFMLNWIREIVKDIQDMEGDRLISVRSMPIALGKIRAIRVVQLLSILSLAPYFFALSFDMYPDNIFFVWLYSIAAWTGAFAGIIAKYNVAFSSLLLKASMFLGTFSMYLL